jgi:hypothetical protein
MSVIQKTWIELLGSSTARCKVDGQFIVKHVDGNQYKVLYQFENDEQAVEAFRNWHNQIHEAKMASSEAFRTIDIAVQTYMIVVERVPHNEFFTGLNYKRQGRILACVSNDDGLWIEDGTYAPEWDTEHRTDPTTKAEKALIRAHAALYYGL